MTHTYTEIHGIKVFNLNPADVVVCGKTMTATQVQAIQQALRRHFIELSAAIENVPGVLSAMPRLEAIVARREAMRVIERFDGVKFEPMPINLDRMQIDVNSNQLPWEEVRCVHGALTWFLENWIEARHPLYNDVLDVLALMNGQ